jgi:pyruvate,water dikinase
MLIDANWGLGETVVGGMCSRMCFVSTPLPAACSRLPSPIRRYFVCGDGEKPVEEPRRKQPCLNSRDVYSLWRLGKQAEEYFATPQDIEWAICEGRLYLLQSSHHNSARD